MAGAWVVQKYSMFDGGHIRANNRPLLTVRAYDIFIYPYVVDGGGMPRSGYVNPEITVPCLLKLTQ